MRIVTLCVLLLITISSIYATNFCTGGICEEEEGTRLLEHFNAEEQLLCKKHSLAVWNLNTDISDENQEIEVETAEEYENFTTRYSDDASQCNWRSFSDPLIRRQFKLLTRLSLKKLPPEEKEQLQEVVYEMQRIFGTATVCPYCSNTTSNQNCSMTLDEGIQNVLDTSNDFDELLYYWKAWRDETGRKMRHLYAKYVPLANKEAVINGYSDLGEQWRSHYEVENLSDKFDELHEQILPLYKQLHAYVRRKLIGVYGEDNICSNGPIPAHLLGHMMGESWMNLENITRPYPNKPQIDITPAMQERNMKILDMVKISEDFFQSLGLRPMTQEFWNNSIFERIPERAMVCHPGALDMCNGRDFRIKMCGRVNMNDLRAIHHEMGHIEYFMYYADQPPLFHDGANEGFHEAIGDTIALSVFTPTHWKALGFMTNVTDDEEQDINALFATALDKLPSVPHSYVVERWRWDLFNGTISVDDMNKKWWEYRLKYQGNCPSVRRTEKDLDPASLYHVPALISYARYFTAFILQFQYHKALCNAARHTGPLHKCDIYGSKEAGERLKALMSLGASKTWPEALKIMTNGETDDLDINPALEYFQPLLEWLEKENKNEVIGWNSNDATLCPQ